MYSEEDIESAVKSGALSKQSAAALKTHIEQRNGSTIADEEHFRLVTGFNDIFVVIATAILLVSIGWIGAQYAYWAGALTVACTSWVLAEFFTRKRHMALPSIVLLATFLGGIFATGYTSLGTPYIALSCAATTLAALLHWLRFHVPITVAAGVTALSSALFASLVAVVPAAEAFIDAHSFISGIVIFGLAMHWDNSDKQRITRKSDVAFWLHLAAASCIVHPIFITIFEHSGLSAFAQTFSVIGLYIIIALISLIIDRRALMVASLIYVLYTFYTLFEAYGVLSLGYAVTALIIGAALLLLSACWHPCRKSIIERLPPACRKYCADI